MITTCTDCGNLYEAGSEEQANEQERWCPACLGVRRGIRTLSCGCCTNGCCCAFHQDAPRGMPAQVCGFHQQHPHPRVTTPRAPEPPLPSFHADDCGGVFDGFSVTSDADPGL